MGLIYDKNEAQQDSNTTREPLADMTGESLPAGEAESALRLRRRSLSEVQGAAAEQPPVPESKPQRPRLVTARQDRPEEPQAESAPASAGLVHLDTLPETQEQPVSAEPSGSTEAEPLFEQAQPRGSRPRLTSRGPHAGVIEPPQVDTASDDSVDPGAESADPAPVAKPGRRRLTAPVPASGEPDSTPEPGRPGLTPPVPAAEESDSTPKPSRPRMSAETPQAEVTEPRVRARRPRLGEQKAAADAENAGGRSRPDPARLKVVVAELKAKQNLPVALLAGLLAMAAGAALWAVATSTINYQIGYMALAVGFLVAGAVRVSGHGVSKSFGWLGAGLSAGGCLLGNFLTNCMSIARETDLPVTAVLAHVAQSVTAGLGLMVAVHPIDLVFYGIAIYGGYRFSFWRLTEARVARLA